MLPEIHDTVGADNEMNWESQWGVKLTDVILNNMSENDKEDFGPVSYDTRGLPEGYSTDLPNTIFHCIRYLPEHRMTLTDLRKRIQENLNRLDAIYRDETKQDAAHVRDSLRPRFPQETYPRFALGRRYRPAQKRRKISEEEFETQNNAAAYEQHVLDWNDITQYPRPSGEEEAQLLEALEAFVMGTEDHPSNLVQEVNDRYTWQHLLSTLKKRVNRNAEFPVYQITNIESEDVVTAFQASAKEAVLRLLVDRVLDEVPPTSDSAVRALRHAAQWAIYLLQWERLPIGPTLHGKTHLHRGMSDYVFHVPTGAFFRPKHVHTHHGNDDGGAGNHDDNDMNEGQTHDEVQEDDFVANLAGGFGNSLGDDVGDDFGDVFEDDEVEVEEGDGDGDEDDEV